MLNRTRLSVLIPALAVVIAVYSDLGVADSSYAQDGATGGTVVNSYSECWKTGYWKDGDQPPGSCSGETAPKKNRCVDVPAGAAVDSDGCPLDSDGDGVPDYLDKCPNTPAGTPVDANGCPKQSEDADGDAVPDALDRCPRTHKGVRVNSYGCEIIQKIVLTDKSVKFAFNKADLSPQAQEILGNAASQLKDNPDVQSIMVVGHTDSKGTDAYNQKLSEKRAAAVRDYLVNQGGVPAEKVVAQGRGEKSPIASNKTEAGRSQNRRVEVSIKNK